MATRITVLDLERRYNLSPGFLDNECSDEHIREIALVIDEWELLASHLKLSKGQIEAIRRNNVSEEVKRSNVLVKWKESFAFEATYKALLKALLAIGKADTACKVCELVRPPESDTPRSSLTRTISLEEPQSPPPVNRKRSHSMFIKSSAHSHKLEKKGKYDNKEKRKVDHHDNGYHKHRGKLKKSHTDPSSECDSHEPHTSSRHRKKSSSHSHKHSRKRRRNTHPDPYYSHSQNAPTPSQLMGLSPCSSSMLKAGLRDRVHNADIETIKSMFRSVVKKTKKSFTRSNIPLERLKSCVINIPADLKGEFGRIFESRRVFIYKAKTIPILFDVIEFFWDYLHPHLLSYLVGRFGDWETVQLMIEYEKELSKFRKKIKIADYIGERIVYLDKKDYKLITAIFPEAEWHEKTLADLEKFRLAFAENFSFLQLLPKMNGLQCSSIAIFFSVPKTVNINHEDLCEFFQLNNVLRLFVGDECIYDNQVVYLSEDDDDDMSVDSLTDDQEEEENLRSDGNQDGVSPVDSLMEDEQEEQETSFSEPRQNGKIPMETHGEREVLIKRIDKDGGESEDTVKDAGSSQEFKEAGGYACQFVKPPPGNIQSECPVCLQILREPYQVTCCGNSFCRLCIERITSENKPCPTCKEEEVTCFRDKRLQRSLYDYKVYCAHKKEGCDWIGELGQFEKHLNLDLKLGKESEGCRYALVDCRYERFGCKVKETRENMPEHLGTDSKVHLELLQKSSKSLDSIFIEDQQHIAMLSQQVYRLNKAKEELMNEHEKEKEIVKELEREKEQAIKEHEKEINTMKEKHQQELATLTQKYEELQKIPHQVSGSARQLPVALTTGTPTPPVTFTMNNYSDLVSDDVGWSSPTFYSHVTGYKMHLKVYPNGEKDRPEFHGKYVTTYIFFRKGEFDDHLSWPFRGYVKIELLDQKENTNHYSYTIEFDDDVPDMYTSRVTEGNTARYGYGTYKFIPIDKLTPRYLQNDCLEFKISRVVVNE